LEMPQMRRHRYFGFKVSVWRRAAGVLEKVFNTAWAGPGVQPALSITQPGSGWFKRSGLQAHSLYVIAVARHR
jgi:hypothetical protein